jgi:ATP-binding cassette subfamily B protein
MLTEGGSRRIASLLAVALAQAAVPLAIISATGTVVARAATRPTLGAVAWPLVTLAALFALQQILSPIAGVLGYRVSSAIDGAMRARAMEAATRPVGVGFLEDDGVQDLIELGAGRPIVFRSATPGGAAVGVIGVTSRYLQGIGAAALIARFSLPLAFLLLVTTFGVRRVIHRANVAQAGAFDDHVPTYRRAGYYTGLATVPLPAKEVRVFGLAEWILGRHREAWTTVTASMSAVRHRTSRRLARSYLLAFPVHALVFVIVGRAAVDGRIGLATLAIVVQAARQLIDLGGIFGDEYQIDFGSASLPAAAELQRRSHAATAAAPAGTQPADGLPRIAIAFEGVTFAYPGQRQAVLEGLDLVVPAGTSLAIVGANGAGKTTLVKLLARLYEPTHGRILIDGIDIRELDVSAWRARLAVIFQDFVRYELSAADNVGLGGPALLHDRTALAAAAHRAGTQELIEALPKGWDTVLARGYTDGAELSGGEWQRVALARALLAVEAGASVLALDEPTANLDVRAEAELFDRFLDLTTAPDGRAGELTTLLVSHRFSTVRRTQRICVLDRGRVNEVGSHDELVAAGGIYARMFGLQAARFHG